ncbi:MAG: hypothetical protein AMXMBFR34_43450 [Myxococcaceae bacterium]
MTAVRFTCAPFYGRPQRVHALGHVREALPVALEAGKRGGAAGELGHQRHAGHRGIRRGARVLAVLVAADELELLDGGWGQGKETPSHGGARRERRERRASRVTGRAQAAGRRVAPTRGALGEPPVGADGDFRGRPLVTFAFSLHCTGWASSRARAHGPRAQPP